MFFKRLSVVILLISTLLITGCTKKENNFKELTIVSNAWIGYAPLFCAFEKGYLKELNIKVIPVVSLSEAMDVFSTSKADIVATTQHEYHQLRKSFKDITAVILLDRSNGGDMILSNVKIDDLKKAKHIYAYLEVDSINMDILNDFLRNSSIKKDKITFFNQDQSSIQSTKDTSAPTIIVTYIPYDAVLKKRGFFEVASTKDLNSILVIDALCTTKKILKNNKTRLKRLKEIIDRSINEITKDKKASYPIVSPYLDNISYKDYINAFKTIKWINNPSKELLKKIKHLGYDSKDLIL